MIFDDHVCTLGEGVLWHPERQELFWFDILEHTLHHRGGDGTRQSIVFPTYASAAGWVDADHLLVATADGLYLVDVAKGTIGDKVCELEAQNTVTRSNDGRADPQGGFWIGTMGVNAEPAAGSIWRWYKGELRLIFPELQITNSICFFPDGETACFTDTNTQEILRVKLDRDGWPTGDPWIHVDLKGTDFRPDGAVIDSDGQLWSAQWGVGRVAVYDADGRETAAHELPATQTSCPGFGGADLSTLFVTSARVGLTESAREDGKTFAIATDAKGQQEHQVIL